MSVVSEGEIKAVAHLLFEAGTLRKIARSHRQLLLTEDSSDHIAAHQYRTCLIGWFLAKLEGADPYRVVMMCLFHDFPETRGGDQNWIHRRYVVVNEDEIAGDQFGPAPFGDELLTIFRDYRERESLESLVAKDADNLEEILALKEHAHCGYREAEDWLHLDTGGTSNEQYRQLRTQSARRLAEEIFSQNVHDWWDQLWMAEKRR